MELCRRAVGRADVEVWRYGALGLCDSGGAMQCADVEVWTCGSVVVRCRRAEAEAWIGLEVRYRCSDMEPWNSGGSM